MEDVRHSESKLDSSAALLQNIINIKNECNPVSLNTVQVSWMSPAVPQNSPRDQCQDFHGGQTFSPPQKYQPFQVGGSPQMMDQASMYQYSPQTQNMQQPPLPLQQQHPQNYPHNPPLQFSPYSRMSQSPKYDSNLFDTQEPEFCPGQSFVSLLTGQGESETLAVPVPAPAGVPPQTETQLQPFSLMPSNACEAVGVHEAGSHSLGASLSLQNIMGSPMNTTQLGKSFFQWQVEQEESKLANIPQDQFLARDGDGDT